MHKGRLSNNRLIIVPVILPILTNNKIFLKILFDIFFVFLFRIINMFSILGSIIYLDDN